MDLADIGAQALTRFDVEVLGAVYSLGNGEHDLTEVAAHVDGADLESVERSLDKMRVSHLTIDLTEYAEANGLKDEETGEAFTAVEVDAPLLSADKRTMMGVSGSESVVYVFYNVSN